MADYTKGMSALHHILTQTPMNTTLSKKGQLPPFTASHLKAGLRTSWTAEQIGRLAIKYESEWYADSSLSKWNEIDHFYQTACENKRQRILAELDECHITKPAEREYPLKLLNAQYQSHIDTWQIEKAQRIKPSLWWDEVAKAQASQTTNTDTATTDNTPVLSNLSPDGKAWYFHPVGIKMFESKKCFCERDFTVNDVKDIVKYLRLSDGINNYQLFTSKNCNLSDNEKTYENFTSELNLMMNKYNINTCLRKIHFLAQSYLESSGFRTLKEYGKKLSYDPYRGRGLIQFTHAGDKEGTIGYKQYFEYLGNYNYTVDYEILNSNLNIGVDVGGYFWTRGKLLNKGDYLKSDTKLNGEWQYYKKTKLLKYTTIDINIVADKDHVEQITFLINGGYSHLQERINYTNKLKEIFDYDNGCISKE